MSGEVEFGKCSICGKETTLERTYFHYAIKCECHSPRHFELVIHCKECVPKEPEITTLTIKTKMLTTKADIQLGTKVYHKDIYYGKELMEVVGIRKEEVELEGDFSGGTHNVCQKDWFNIKGLL